jgi:predicted MPP superfamily phosphohydrolase
VRGNLLALARVNAWLKQSFFARALALIALLGVCIGLYAVVIEPSRLVVNQYELAIPNWPSALSGLRVALISDTHIGSPFWDLARLRELVTRVNEQQADLVLLAGDYQTNGVLGGKFVAIEPIAAEFAKLHAPLGVISILGNHDWWNGGAHVRRALENDGIKVLDDEAVRIDARGASFCLLGISDIEVRTYSANRSLDHALPGLPLLALVHEPDIFHQMDARPSLVMAGHTHGGQVKLPIIGRPVVPSGFGQRYAAGHVVENGRHLFVTTGLGTSIYPIRLGVPPEIAILTLRAEPQAPSSR